MGDRESTDSRRISEMRNLGPACEAHLNAVGIFTAEQLIEIGEESAFLKVLAWQNKKGNAKKYCNAGYLYALYGAIHDVEWRSVPKKQKTAFKQLTADLRESGMFPSVE